MITLTRNQTGWLRAGLLFENESPTQDVSDMWRMLFAASFLTNNEYENLRAEWLNWKEAYDEEELYGTTNDNQTFQITGIDKWPDPPPRS